MYMAFEGGGFTGKTAQIIPLVKHLKHIGIDVVSVREPGTRPVAEVIRNLLLTDDTITPLTDAYLYAAARSQMLRKTVLPHLMSGRWVISDRCVASSLAYQGHLSDLGIETVAHINAPLFESGLPLPYIVFYLDTPPEIAQARYYDASQREPDKFDDGNVEQLIKLREGYLLTSQHPWFRDTWVTIDGAGTVEEVHTRVREALYQRVPELE